MTEKPLTDKQNNAIRTLFEADSVAVIGASTDPAKLSAWPIKALSMHGFAGRVYAVNPRHDRIGQFPCFPTIDALPDDVEAAIILLPAKPAVDAAAECISKGIRSLIIPAQGFAEAAKADQELGNRLRELINDGEAALCGPNTNGLANFQRGMTLSFSPILQMPGRVTKGNVSIISQSGSMVSSILAAIGERGLGLAKTVTCGNELSLSLSEYLEFMAQDADTRIVLLFVEAVRNGASFRKAVAQCKKNGKHVIALKTARSPAGERVALSHTGSIAGSYENAVAVLEREGALVVKDIDTMAATAELLQRFQWSVELKPKTAVVAISGGYAGLIADLAYDVDFNLPELTRAAEQRLLDISAQTRPMNPYDTAAQHDRLDEQIAVFKDDGFNQIIFSFCMLVDQVRRPILTKAIEALRKARMTRAFFVGPGLDDEDRRRIEEAGYSWCVDHAPLISGLKIIDDWLEMKRTGFAEDFSHDFTSTNANIQTGSRLLDENESKELLRGIGIKVPIGIVLDSRDGFEASVELKWPLVAKGLSNQIAHKSELGLVAVGLRSVEEVRRAREFIGAKLEQAGERRPRVLVEEMVENALEAFIGFQRDPNLGATMVIGAGGIFVELLRDVIVLSLPFTRARLEWKLSRTKFGRLLATGYRGTSYDYQALIEVVLNLQRSLHSDIEAIDINPLFVGRDREGVIAADVKVLIRRYR